MPDGVTFNTATPIMPVRDIAKAIEFYEGCLGLQVRGRFGEPPTYAVLGADGASLHLSLDRDGGVAGKVGCYINVKGVEAVFERCKAKGADLDSDLGVRDYGMRDFTVHDPDENHVTVGENASG